LKDNFVVFQSILQRCAKRNIIIAVFLNLLQNWFGIVLV